MSALAKIKPISSTVSTLEMVLDWMDESFDGNLPQAATLAAEKAKKARLIGGCGTNGEQVLANCTGFAEFILKDVLHGTAEGKRPIESRRYSVWHYVGGAITSSVI